MRTTALVSLFLIVGGPLLAQTSSARSEIEAFNKALEHATRHMDNAASVALWDDDGVSLLPSTPPISGKAAIAKFYDSVTAQMPGGKMDRFDMHCQDIQISGSWASEWCSEHQIVSLPGKPKFDGWGKMLFVLHRSGDGKWRIHDEMWNQAQPETKR